VTPHPLLRVEHPEWPPLDPSPEGDIRWLWITIIGTVLPWAMLALCLWRWL
jgi:hypothetical protein